MPSTVIVGAQWGDEGKGKVVDLVSDDYDYVVRYGGGNNAGHTIVHNGQTLAMRLIPCGIMCKTITPVIGNGVVVDPHVLANELKTLHDDGISTDKLVISGNAHLIMPWHVALDGASEKRLGNKKVGTTKNGIGPCYQDKVARTGIRVQDLLDPDVFRDKVTSVLAIKNLVLDKIYGLPTYSVDEICDEYAPFADMMRPYVTSTEHLLSHAIRDGKKVLFEGAQATMLDVDHGTYPFVTSSSCTAGGACTGSGLGPTQIQKVCGVSKAYITRVGSGPFPTEQFGEDGDTLRSVGHEFGVVTGRPRRCGWFDAVVARYATEVNGLTDMAITKLDVLSAFDTIKVCVAYDIDGTRVEDFPTDSTQVNNPNLKPIYEELPGWKGVDISGCRKFEELPENAQKYIHFLEQQIGVPVSIIGCGPDHDQTILHGWNN